MDTENTKTINSDNTEKHLMIEHDYDGIKELDNPPPPWLMNLFYITVAFAIAYAAYYHWFKQGDLQAVEYQKEVAAVEAKKNPGKTVEAKLMVLFTDEASLKAGAEVFSKNCTSCHGKQGEGMIGPNLCDDYWITGNTFESITNTIRNGTPNGMTAFTALPDEQTAQVASFILKKLQGSNPPNAKASQGQKM
jgi:cytochrome c oxidase cbb3-type subunit 3